MFGGNRHVASPESTVELVSRPVVVAVPHDGGAAGAAAAGGES